MQRLAERKKAHCNVSYVFPNEGKSVPVGTDTKMNTAVRGERKNIAMLVLAPNERKSAPVGTDIKTNTAVSGEM